MNAHFKSVLLLTVIAAFLLTGCATMSSQIPANAPAPEQEPLSVVAEPSEYAVWIYTMDPDETVEITDAPVPLAPAEPAPTGEGPVTKRQAEALAIAHAGLTQEDVSFLFSKEDIEDGIPVFEVSFRSGTYSYEFEIASETGEILSFEKDGVRGD